MGGDRDRDSQRTSIDEGAVRRDAPHGSVLMVAGEGVMRTVPLAAEVVIGRAAECDLVIDHRALSRRHATVRRTPALSVQDLESTNGTRIGGEVVRGGEPVAIALGESFHIGPFAFFVVAGRPAAAVGKATPAQLVVADPTAEAASALVKDIAAADVNVLIQGETGVGKEVLASTVHALSGRTGPLSRINCAALSETLLESELFGHERGAFTGAVAAKTGLLEYATGGSVFLDEIGELPLALQAKLLRAVEAREIVRLGSARPTTIDVRFIAATNRDLTEEVAAGRFRADLYFRLDGVGLRIPPLRERRGAIVPLALGFITEAAKKLKRGAVEATPALLAALEAHDWPGNVRELKAVIERAVLLAGGGGVLDAGHLAFAPRAADRGGGDKPALAGPAAAAAGATPDLSDLTDVQRADRARVVAALESCAGNQTRAAKQLGVSRATLAHKLALYKIPRPRA